MKENFFEAFVYYLISILSVFGWTKTILKFSDRIFYWLAFSDRLKHFWSIRIRFAIEFKRFRMDENTFEAFAFYLLLIIGVFGWTKYFWRLRIVFAFHFERFRLKENTFEAFPYYLLSILGVFGWRKTPLKASDRICCSFWAFSDERKHF